MTAETTPPPYHADSRPSPFVGRARELEELRFGLDALHAWRGHLFLVSGEPGIGKTQLTHKLSAAGRAFGALTLWGRCWGAHIVLSVGFAPFAVIGVALLLLPAMRAIIAKISIPSAQVNPMWPKLLPRTE